METVHGVEQRGESAINERRELETALGGGTLLRYRKNAEVAHQPVLADHGPEGLVMS